MPNRKRFLFSAPLFLALALFTNARAYAGDVPSALLHYEIVELPTLDPPGTNLVNSNATGLNEHGHCVGVAETVEGTVFPVAHAVIWIDGEVIDLGATTEPHYNGNGKGINDFDDTVGYWSVDLIPGPGTQSRPFTAPFTEELFDPGLGLGGFGWSWGINNSRQTTLNIGNEIYVSDPIDGLREIRLPGGPVGFSQQAWEINNSGQVCGAARGVDTNWHSFRYDYNTDTIVDLHNDQLHRHSVGYGINDNGDIAGFAEQYDFLIPPMVWASDGRVIQLPIADLGFAHFYGAAEHINNHGDVVGLDISDLPEPPIGWISFDVLDAASPTKVVLHSLLSPQGQSEWTTRIHPFEINEKRQIVGTGLFNGLTRGFLMTPVLVGDLNGDCAVDTADLGILLDEFGTAGISADINGDGVVDTADLGALLGVFGFSCSSAW